MHDFRALNLFSIVTLTCAASVGCAVDTTSDGGEAAESASSALYAGPWNQLVHSSVKITSAPSVLPGDTSNSRTIFFRGPNQHLWFTTQDVSSGHFGADVDLGGVALSSAPSATGSTSTPKKVFYRGPNGHLWYSAWDGGPWWGAPVDLGGVQLLGAPSAVKTGSNAYKVFYRGPNGHLFLSRFDGGPWWSAPADLGGDVLTTDPNAIVLGANHYQVFYGRSNGHLAFSEFNGGPWWSGVNDLGITISSTPSATYGGAGDVVYYAVPGGQLVHSEHWNGQQWWSAPFFHGGAMASAPSADPNMIWYVFYQNTSGFLTMASPFVH